MYSVNIQEEKVQFIWALEMNSTWNKHDFVKVAYPSKGDCCGIVLAWIFLDEGFNPSVRGSFKPVK